METKSKWCLHRAVVCCAPAFCFNRSTNGASAAFAAGISSLFVPSFLFVLESPLKPIKYTLDRSPPAESPCRSDQFRDKPGIT